jgi:hypothetical protein
MDVVKFIEERNRMCASHEGNCAFCPANGDICLVSLQSQLCADEQVNLVEEWSAAHPRKTRQSVFLKQYPEAEIGKNGCLVICPTSISADCRKKYGDCANRLCPDCRREFWTQEVEYGGIEG